ncbi:Uncharacterised protein [Legionella steigerwaltii]|uniref:Uncharacterized protein n=1 Tax=Legionella steigerwaltii TaxID=460 RepID=A0A378L7A9_9GAMM|nr:hypothetical protein [Legionella steigerwaltii]KTD69960.1 hypothetical protein Lstg_3401 [Legionella steigerwaltii]STY21728.1 Uncharacterised protein [Legionella steigerwaltii]
MPGSTSNILANLQARVPTSSAAHRNTQRGNAGLAVTQLTVQAGMQITNTTSPIPLIPIAFAQTLNSGYAVVRSDTHLNEKFIQGLQAIFSAVILGLAISLVFNDDQIVKQVMYLIQLLYSALFLVTWGGSEVSKDSTATPTTNAVAPHLLKSIIKRPVEEDIEKAEKSEEEDDASEEEMESMRKASNS